MSDNETRLLPCPFCGERKAVKLVSYSDRRDRALAGRAVECGVCDARSAVMLSGNSKFVDKIVVDMWNRLAGRDQ